MIHCIFILSRINLFKPTVNTVKNEMYYVRHLSFGGAMLFSCPVQINILVLHLIFHR